jgi:DEAD/DEAH box helicase domain-containing protein
MQQAGRAGRRTQDCVSVFFPSGTPIDMHMIKHPQKLVHAVDPFLTVNWENDWIKRHHLQCAALEYSFNQLDTKYFDTSMDEVRF